MASAYSPTIEEVLIGGIIAIILDVFGAIWAPFSSLICDWCMNTLVPVLMTPLNLISAIGGIGSATTYAVGSSCLLGTLSGLIGCFILYGPCALCCFPCTGIIALCDGALSAFLNFFAGGLGGALAYIASGIIQKIMAFILPSFWYGGHKTMYALGAGCIGGAFGAVAGAILGGVLGFFIGLPCFIIGCIPGAFNGALLGAISGLIVGFGTGTIAGGWH